MTAQYRITLWHPRVGSIPVTVTANDAVAAKRKAQQIGWPFSVPPQRVRIEDVQEVAS